LPVALPSDVIRVPGFPCPGSAGACARRLRSRVIAAEHSLVKAPGTDKLEYIGHLPGLF
jgi:hypothetical protein